MFLIPSNSDSRDFLYREIQAATTTSPLPTRYRSLYTRWEDQGSSNYCVAHAFTAGMEIKQMMVAGTPSVPELSRLFLHSECKKIDGYPQAESTTLRAALKVLQKVGVCQEALYPWHYNEAIRQNSFPPKSEALYVNATHYQIANYWAIGPDVMALKHAIYQGGCVFVANRCFGDYTANERGYTPPPSGPYYGNHATLMIGWDDETTWTYRNKTYTGFFIHLNSYGNRYDQGLQYVPYEAINTWAVAGRQWFVEAWTAVSKSPLKSPHYHQKQVPRPLVPSHLKILLTLGSSRAIVNGAVFFLDAVPQLRNKTTFVPIRFFTEHMPNTQCDFEAAKKQIHVTDYRRGQRYTFTLGSPLVMDSHQTCIYTLIAPPFIQAGRAFIPLRACSELLGAQVDYLATTKQILINM